MASEGTSTVPRMGSFKRVLFGYRREEVDAALAARDAAIEAVESHASAAEAELASLSGMVIEREREIRGLGERLREANERQAKAIVDETRIVLKRELELLPGGTDGEGSAGWVVLDYLDAVLHVFTAEARERYQLEDLWREAPRLDAVPVTN